MPELSRPLSTDVGALSRSLHVLWSGRSDRRYHFHPRWRRGRPCPHPGFARDLPEHPLLLLRQLVVVREQALQKLAFPVGNELAVRPRALFRTGAPIPLVVGRV